MRFGAAKKIELSDSVGKELEACLNRGGCETLFEEDIRPFVWKKAVSNSGYSMLSSLLRLKVGEFLAMDEGKELIKAVWREDCDVAQAVIGVDLWPETLEELPKLIDGFASYYPSMAQDVLIHQRQAEISLLNGTIANYGEKHGIPTPVNTALTNMLNVIQ